MNTKVTISKEKYDELKRDAAAWRRAAVNPRDTVIFNATRDNGGKGVPVEKFIRILQKLEREDLWSRA
ncbi:MAG: hypothetical protein AAB442_03320 [Patescibacteria group bacterium]